MCMDYFFDKRLQVVLNEENVEADSTAGQLVILDNKPKYFYTPNAENIYHSIKQVDEEQFSLLDAQFDQTDVYVSRRNGEYVGWLDEKQFINKVIDEYMDLFRFLRSSPFSSDEINKLQRHSPLFSLLERVFEESSNLALDLRAVFESSFDVIYVADQDGNTLRVSSAAKELWGVDATSLVGQNVYDLEKEGIYSPSITRLVLEGKRPVRALQRTKTGRTLTVVGTPIKNDKNEIIRVVNTSRDMTAESRLEEEVGELRSVLEGYRKQLHQAKLTNKAESHILYKSSKMESVFSLASTVADADSTVLITGESGVGKEVVATYVHDHSKRSDQPFIKINCGAIPEQLLESELFGHEKGSFTGAVQKKKGVFQLADRGTLFLDEVGERPLHLQVKLLRVLQDQEIYPLGADESIQVNVRIIAATNKNLETEMKNGRFRQDLYYRLHVVPLHIPPLRERQEDIIPLCMYFKELYNEKYEKAVKFDTDLLEAFQHYSWPGNVRELQNVTERFVVTAIHPIVTLADVPASVFSNDHHVSGHREGSIQVPGLMTLKEATESVERALLWKASKEYPNTYDMAVQLGVNQSTISRKLKKYNIVL